MVHFSAGDRHRQSIQRIVRSPSRPEPVRESEEIPFVDGVEHYGACALDDLVFQSRDTPGIMHLMQLALGMMDENGLNLRPIFEGADRDPGRW